MADIRAFKLRIGDEFLAQIVEEGLIDDKKAYSIKNPVMPREQLGPDGQPHLVFIPWCSLAATRDFNIRAEDCFFEPSPADENLANGYKQAFKIGVIAPVGQKIIH